MTRQMTNNAFDYCDALGPGKIVHIYEPGPGLRGILVVDNVAAGPAIGGLRMAPDVSLEECFRLARAMTFKSAAAGLPHGGGKAVIFFDPTSDESRKEDCVRAFAQGIAPIEDFIVGPDMGTNETAMGWVRDEIGRSVGLPREVGGIPLDEIGATGFGLAVAAEVVAERGGPSLTGARVAVQGFGSVGRHAARNLVERGAVLVAAADSKGTVHDPAGLNVSTLIDLKASGARVIDYPSGEKLERDAIVGIDCDIWIPAARPDVIREDNVSHVKARVIVQGANIGVTGAAETALHKRGVVCVPDFISNAGGVICAAVEYQGGTQAQAFQTIEEKIRTNTAEVLARAAAQQRTPREAAVAMAEERVYKAMQLRRWK
jgi:glutamate dehydrogenase (NAD(P)+)